MLLPLLGGMSHCSESTTKSLGLAGVAAASREGEQVSSSLPLSLAPALSLSLSFSLSLSLQAVFKPLSLVQEIAIGFW